MIRVVNLFVKMMKNFGDRKLLHSTVIWLLLMHAGGIFFVLSAQIRLQQITDVKIRREGTADFLNSFGGGLNTVQFQSFDFDNDGVDDLLAFDRMANRATVFLRTAEGWQHAPQYEYLLPSDLRNWVIMTDADCDGIKDIFTSTLLGIRVYKTIRTSQGQLQWQLLQSPILTQGSSGSFNLQVEAGDVPFIGDVDGDGLTDILVYSFALGGFIDFHKNVSTENGGTCGSLRFRRVTQRWGDFEECDCNLFAFGDQDCGSASARVQHAGGKTLLYADMTGNGIPDLLGGHELCEELYFFPNTGSRADALFESFISGFPADRAVTDLPFAAPYLTDADGDGVLDLLVSSNLSFNLLNGLDTRRSVRFFKNTGTNARPNFVWQEDDFLKNTMFDVGEHAFPSTVDVNGDGLADILVGSRGLWQGNEFYASLSLLEAIGDASNPNFRLVSEDFAGLASLKLSNLKAITADLNRDNIPDLIFTGTTGNVTQIYWIQGTRSGSQWQVQASNARTIPFSLALNDNVYFFDVDQDGFPDLLLARANGQLSYFRNTGNAESPGFQMQEEIFLGIDRSTSATNLSLAFGDFNGDGKADMLSSDFSGRLRFYSDIRSGRTEPIDNVLDFNGGLTNTRLGTRTFLAAYPISHGKSRIIVGNVSGGLWLFESEATITSIAKKETITFSYWPNPIKDRLFVRSAAKAEAAIYNLNGQRIDRAYALRPDEEQIIELWNLPVGIYLLVVRFENGSQQSFKLIKR